MNRRIRSVPSGPSDPEDGGPAGWEEQHRRVTFHCLGDLDGPLRALSPAHRGIGSKSWIIEQALLRFLGLEVVEDDDQRLTVRQATRPSPYEESLRAARASRRRRRRNGGSVPG